MSRNDDEDLELLPKKMFKKTILEYLRILLTIPDN